MKNKLMDIWFTANLFTFLASMVLVGVSETPIPFAFTFLGSGWVLIREMKKGGS